MGVEVGITTFEEFKNFVIGFWVSTSGKIFQSGPKKLISCFFWWKKAEFWKIRQNFSQRIKSK